MLAVAKALDQAGYTKVGQNEFDRWRRKGVRPVYAQQYPVGVSIYETPWKSDFILYHPERHRGCLAIKIRWQEQPGTTDQKLPFQVLTIEKNICPAMIVLGGKGFSEGAVGWVRAQAGKGKLRAVHEAEEFQQLVSTGGL